MQHQARKRFKRLRYLAELGLIPGARVRYLAEIAEAGRAINTGIEAQAEAAARAESFYRVLRELGDKDLPAPLKLYDNDDLIGERAPRGDAAVAHSDRKSYRRSDEAQAEHDNQISILLLRQRYNDAVRSLTSDSIQLLQEWPKRLQGIVGEEFVYVVRGKEIRGETDAGAGCPQAPAAPARKRTRAAEPRPRASAFRRMSPRRLAQASPSPSSSSSSEKQKIAKIKPIKKRKSSSESDS